MHLGTLGLQDVAHELAAQRDAVRGPQAAEFRAGVERARQFRRQLGLARFEIRLERERNDIARLDTGSAQQLDLESELAATGLSGEHFQQRSCT